MKNVRIYLFGMVTTNKCHRTKQRTGSLARQSIPKGPLEYVFCRNRHWQWWQKVILIHHKTTESLILYFCLNIFLRNQYFEPVFWTSIQKSVFNLKTKQNKTKPNNKIWNVNNRNYSLKGVISLNEIFTHNALLAVVCVVAQGVLSTILWTPSWITDICTQSAVFITPGNMREQTVSVFWGGARLLPWFHLCCSTCLLASGHWITKQWQLLPAAFVDSFNCSSIRDLTNYETPKTF